MSPVYSQTPPSASAPPAISPTVVTGPTVEKIAEMKKLVEDDASLAQELKTQVLELYERALTASQRKRDRFAPDGWITT